MSLWSSGQKVEAEGPCSCPGPPVAVAVGAAGGSTLDRAPPALLGLGRHRLRTDENNHCSEQLCVLHPESPAVHGLSHWLPLSFSIFTCLFLCLTRSGSHLDPHP